MLHRVSFKPSTPKLRTRGPSCPLQGLFSLWSCHDHLTTDGCSPTETHPGLTTRALWVGAAEAQAWFLGAPPTGRPKARLAEVTLRHAGRLPEPPPATTRGPCDTS